MSRLARMMMLPVPPLAMLLVWSITTALALGLAMIAIRRVATALAHRRARAWPSLRQATDAPDVRRELCDLDELLHEAVARTRARAHVRSVRLVPGLTPPQALVADRRRLVQSLCDLLERAVDAASPGAEVIARAVQVGGDVRFTVGDLPQCDDDSPALGFSIPTEPTMLR